MIPRVTASDIAGVLLWALLLAVLLLGLPAYVWIRGVVG